MGKTGVKLLALNILLVGTAPLWFGVVFQHLERQLIYVNLAMLNLSDLVTRCHGS
jgi:hypothetical protein